jgi:outer membrane receptor protein involved in Fe transport
MDRIGEDTQLYQTIHVEWDRLDLRVPDPPARSTTPSSSSKTEGGGNGLVDRARRAARALLRAAGDPRVPRGPVLGGNGLRAADGQARALQQQRHSANITNVVAADQIGRFPDANIGDAMKRIPGIAVQVDQGEARFGLIRGTEPRLNSITLNGERVPSAEGEVREVQLDLIPADMVQSIEVNKAVTPDMDADAIGASVNIVTRQDPPGQRCRPPSVAATTRSPRAHGAGQRRLRQPLGR